jgi:P-type E1-E2 ATPase
MLVCFACLQVVHNTDLVVGDVLMVNMGDKVVADGIMIDGFHLVVDEASLTGWDRGTDNGVIRTILLWADM